MNRRGFVKSLVGAGLLVPIVAEVLHPGRKFFLPTWQKSSSWSGDFYATTGLIDWYGSGSNFKHRIEFDFMQWDITEIKFV